MITTLALDPGRTTGIAIATKGSNSFEIAYYQEELHHYELYNLLDIINPNVVICESFEFRQGRTGIDLYPCELIGVVNFYAQTRNLRSLYFQQAWIQSKKGHFSDKKLKDMDLYQKGVEHGRSAVKHLLHWFYFGAGGQYFVPATDEPPILVRDLKD